MIELKQSSFATGLGGRGDGLRLPAPFCLGGRFALDHRFHHRSLGFRREEKVTSAAIAELNILVPHQDGDYADRLQHVATGAGLVANQGHALLVTNPQTVVVSEDLSRNLGSEFLNLSFGIDVRNFTEFEGLNLQKGLNDSVH